MAFTRKIQVTLSNLATTTGRIRDLDLALSSQHTGIMGKRPTLPATKHFFVQQYWTPIR